MRRNRVVLVSNLSDNGKVLNDENPVAMRIIITAKLFIAFVLTALALSSCTSPSSSKPEFSTKTPTQLRAIDNSSLSVVVRIDGKAPDYTGERRADGSWLVRLELTLDETHSFVARWYYSVEGQRVLLMEQQGEFYANSATMVAQANTTDNSGEGGDPRFDVDCDNQTNLEEIKNASDPVNSPGCNGVTDSTATESAANDIAGDPAAESDSNDNSGGPTASPLIPDLVQIAAGCFDMGSTEFYPEGSDTVNLFHREDQRLHRVCVDSFNIGLYEVTFDQYTAFSDSPGILQVTPNDRGWGLGSRPVINVNWVNAVAYTKWLSELTGDTYRLPTEAEWEYAARGNTKTPYWTGDTLRDDEEHFNSADPWGDVIATGQPFRDRTRPVGSLKPNPFGLYDMLGNVMEHTCSLYSKNYENGIENQCNDDPDLEHVYRGGGIARPGSYSRVYSRTGVLPATSDDGGVGFRVVMENR